MNIKKIRYNTLKKETTIFYSINKFGKEKESFKTFKGKISFKGENPTIEETLKFIEMKGGLKY